MSVWARLLMNIYLVIFNLALIILIVTSFGLIPYIYIDQTIKYFYANWQLSGFLIILLVGGLFLLFKRKKSDGGRYRSIIQYNELGELKITLDAIESLTTRVVTQQIKGVREVKPTVYKSDKGIGVDIVVNVIPDINLPDLSKKIQDLVFEHLQDIVGITANPITVTIKDIVTDGIKVK
ncbi:MAG TPA: alkaline shock response membrane anchor protein AmaP [Clostridia bacterium]|nr:alkaline shock response membrane anchor protein AmaP [Clostridia bacterium]